MKNQGSSEHLNNNNNALKIELHEICLIDDAESESELIIHSVSMLVPFSVMSDAFNLNYFDF